MKYKTIILIIIIMLIGSFLRLWQLDTHPAGLNADEAALGYNAYSLIQTGKDEYGAAWPLTFKSFGDYKPGLYVYIIMPFVATMGLNEWAVRLPSAFFGIGTVLLVFFLAKEIFKNDWIGICSSMLLAISPWHLQFSRGGWESNVATFFITLGIFLFIKGLKNIWWLFLSMLAFLGSMYDYQSPRVIVPVLFILLIIFYKKQLLSLFKTSGQKIWQSIFLLIVLILLSLPLLLQFTSGSGTARFSGLSFYSDQGPTSRINELRGEHNNSNGIFSQLLHNKLTAYGPNFLGHFLDHFNPEFLFINGDEVIRNKVPEVGEFYLIEALFLVVGLFSLVGFKSEHKKLLISWIMVAPLASSLTFQTPNALRSFSLVVPLILVAGFGFWAIINWLKNTWKIFGVVMFSVILTFECVHYLESYYVHYPKKYPVAWEYGFKQMVPRLESLQNSYNKIVITDTYDQPYILVLFFEKYNPAKYQVQAHLTERDKFNFGTIRSFDKYEFRQINPDEIGKNPGVLYIGTEKEMPKNANIIDKVNFPNDQPVFIFAKGG